MLFDLCFVSLWLRSPACCTRGVGVAVTIALLAMAGLQQAANGLTRRAGTLLATAAAAALMTLIGTTLPATTTDLLLVAAPTAGIVADLRRSPVPT